MQNAPLRVFLSSTTQDFYRYRSLTAEAIKQAGHVPVVMEDFPPGGVLSVCLQAVRECDVYVLLAGFRYGSDARVRDRDGNAVLVREAGGDGHNKSYTELEFDEAKASGKLILAYMPHPQVPPEAMMASYFPGLFQDFEQRVRASALGASEEDAQRQIADAIRENMDREAAFIARVNGDPASYVAAPYRDPNLLPSKVTTDIIQGTQGRIPGELALRRADLALRIGNLGAAIDQLATAVFYLSSTASGASLGAQLAADVDDGARHETPAHRPPFMLAVALLRNRPPGSILSEEIVGIEDNLKRSLRATRTRLAYAVWAYIKWEHYIRRGIVRPHQIELDEILRQCGELPPTAGDRMLQDFVLHYFPDLASKLVLFVSNPQFRALQGTLGVADGGA